MSAQRGKPRSPGGSPGGRGSGRADSARRNRSGARRASGADTEPAVGAAVPPKGRFWSKLPSSDNTVFGLSTSRAVILAIVVLMLALTLAVPLRTYISQRSDAAQIATERQALQKEVDALRAQNARFDDPAYIEALARERLRYVKPGETPFQVQLPGDYQEPVKQQEKEIPLTGPWYRDLWQTISEPPVVTETKATPAPMPVVPQQPEEQGVPTG